MRHNCHHKLIDIAIIRVPETLDEFSSITAGDEHIIQGSLCLFA